jgi:hypothetical protein
MENLVIKPGTQLFGRKTIGLLWILIAIIMIIARRDSLSGTVWLESVIFVLIGIITMTPLSGAEKSQIEVFDDCLKIIWSNWYRKVTVMDSEIESILLAENGVLIRRKNKKDLKIQLYFMNRDQKKKVFEFFTEYAKLKNLLSQ